MNQEDIFTNDGSDWWNKAMLMHDWPYKWSVYARGYKEAGDRLVLSIERSEGLVDFMVYPILYLYRHFLEISIKASIRDAQVLLGIEARKKPNRKNERQMAEAAQGHHLESLWKYLIELMIQVHSELEMPRLDETSRVVNAFHSLDLYGDAARYPQGLDGKPSLKMLHEVNLRRLREDMEMAQDGFYQIEGILDYERDYGRTL